jgi:hypothetical protein
LPVPDRGGSKRITTAQVSRVALAAALAALFASTEVGAKEKSHRRGEAKHAQTEKVPNGPLMIVVSIASQRVSLYADGTYVAHGPVSTGMRGHPTPIGIFTVLQKDRYHHSNIYSGAPMPFMQRITWSGVAIHQGVLPGYPASHGCIRTSNEFATRLWGITKVGVRVIVARNDVAPATFASPRLFVPRQVAVAEPVADTKPEAKPDPKPELRSAMAPAPTPASAGLRVAGPPTAAPADENEEEGAAAEPAAPATAAAVDPSPAPAIDAAKTAANTAMQVEPPRKPGAVSVFVSGKTGRLYVRQNNVPLFDVPIAISDPGRPLGTHLYTALDVTNGGNAMRWSVVTIPGDAPKADRETPRGKHKARREPEAAPPVQKASLSAADALNRLEMPKEAVDRISEMLTPGSSLIISDHPISGETGRDTDFIILTH